MGTAEEIEQGWQLRLKRDCPETAQATRDSIIGWLMGEDRERLDGLSSDRLAIAKQSMEFRYRILQQRYFNVPPERAYRHLIRRLGSLVLLRNKIRTWIALSRDRRRSVIDVVQEVVQELLNGDRYLQAQIARISRCTDDPRLRNSLLLASLEEYCLRPIRNQPLLLYRFVNYLRRSQRGGMTQVPAKDLIRLVSAEISPGETDEEVNLADTHAIAYYEDSQNWAQQQRMRLMVQREFQTYLAEQVEPIAAEWLKLYLQGHSQNAIAQMLDVPIDTVYRLREKVSYHAIRVFALKAQPNLVANWLETSLQEHALGLTPHQWESYLDRLTPTQRTILERLKAGEEIEPIARSLGLKTSQVLGEWSKLYLAAQSLRNSR
jgi:DNA-binding CsgD family transcriptional regulator